MMVKQRKKMEGRYEDVLISIKPKWCDLIASGKKTMEVRKTRPKLETPFKCYIYCTLTGSNEFFKDDLNGDVAAWNRGKWGERKGNVIGEFICDDCSLLTKANYRYIEQFGCVSKEALHAYMGFETGRELSYSDGCWGWNISDPKIYETPLDISNFFYACDKHSELNCTVCVESCKARCKQLRRPPQSWCYVMR